MKQELERPKSRIVRKVSKFYHNKKVFRTKKFDKKSCDKNKRRNNNNSSNSSSNSSSNNKALKGVSLIRLVVVLMEKSKGQILG